MAVWRRSPPFQAGAAAGVQPLAVEELRQMGAEELNLREEEALPKHPSAAVLIPLGAAVLRRRPLQTKEGVEVDCDVVPLLSLNCCRSCLT